MHDYMKALYHRFETPSRRAEYLERKIKRSLMIADEVPIVEISNQMGHARSITTTNIYGHVIAAAHAKGLSTLNKFDDILIPTKNVRKVSGE